MKTDWKMISEQIYAFDNPDEKKVYTKERCQECGNPDFVMNLEEFQVCPNCGTLGERETYIDENPFVNGVIVTRKKRKYKPIRHIFNLLCKIPIQNRMTWGELTKIAKVCAHVKRELGLSQTYYIVKLCLIYYGYAHLTSCYRDIKTLRKLEYDKKVNRILKKQTLFRIDRYTGNVIG